MLPRSGSMKFPRRTSMSIQKEDECLIAQQYERVTCQKSKQSHKSNKHDLLFFVCESSKIIELLITDRQLRYLWNEIQIV